MSDVKWIKETLDKLDVKVDKIDQRLDVMNERHVENSADLREHMLRTELNEEAISLLREQIEPIKKHVQMTHGILKFIGLIATLVAIIEGVVALLNFLQSSHL